MAQSDYGHDLAGRLTDLVHHRGQTTFVDYGWSFDAAGRMTQYVNSVDGTADYTSDATGQLTAADYDYQSDESYTYDANGNRVLANGSTYTTGANNQLLSDGTYRYQYDAEGNRTHRFIDTNQNGRLDSGDTDITQYTWDHRNRLVKVEHRPGYAAAVDKVVEYAYDYQNRWVRKRLDADGDGHTDQRRLFVYDGNQIVMDFWRANSGNMQIGHLRERYLWGPAVDQILAEEEVDGGTADSVQWTLTDHLNTVRDIAKYDPQTGTTTVVNHLVYDAFGNVTSETDPAVDSLFLFTARPFDADTGLQNNLNRWYDPAVGRWLSEDPMGFAAGINLCEYVGNAPVYHTDPYGLKPLGQKWDVPDFFWWYYFGFGQEVSLHKIGLLQPWWQEIKPQVQVQLRHRLVPKLISQLSCESGITKAQVNLSDLVPVVLDVHSGGGMFDVLTIMGHSNVRVRGTCEVTIDCKGCNEDLWISASLGTCDLWFHVRDRFQNPLDIGGQFAPIDLPFAKPYDLVATWYWKFTWKETYPCPKK